MTQENTCFQIGLNIHLVSFQLPKKTIKDNESIRVSITTMPEEKKQHFHLQAKKMNNSNHVFSLNIANQTKKIIMVFRKKSFLDNDPIIASTIIHKDDFPKIPQGMTEFNCGVISTDVKTINIYYPLQKQLEEIREEPGKVEVDPITGKINRKILGQMQVQMSFTSPLPNIENEKSNKIKFTNIFHKNHSSDKKGEYERINNYSFTSKKNIE